MNAGSHGRDQAATLDRGGRHSTAASGSAMRVMPCSARKRRFHARGLVGQHRVVRALAERFMIWRAKARGSWSLKRQPRKTKPSAGAALLHDRRDRGLDVDLGQHLDEVAVRDQVVAGRRVAPQGL
jgi:hypothetical protein